MTTSTLFIAVDWGTSHLRAYLCKVGEGSELTLIDQCDGPGVVKVNQHFQQTLIHAITPGQRNMVYYLFILQAKLHQRLAGMKPLI